MTPAGSRFQYVDIICLMLIKMRLRSAILICLLFCTVVQGANDFSADANCMTLYNFESGALTADSKGGNTLTNHGVTDDLVNFKQGSCSGNFHLSDYMDIADADLDAGFPLKNGDTNKKISICFWVRFDATASYMTIAGKWDGPTNKRSILFCCGYPISTKFALLIGYNSGLSFEKITDDTVAIGNGKWYHVAYTFQDSDKSYRIRIYDADADTTTESTGNSTNNINVEDAPFEIGRYDAGGGVIDGRIDEMVVFKDILTSDEIDEIRAGTYGAPPPSAGQVIKIILN